MAAKYDHVRVRTMMFRPTHDIVEFLDFIRLMQLFDLELAGEFLVMASSLMQIKVRMLLPKAVDESGEELPGEDPRNELVQQLLQYSQYKEISREFSVREEEQRYVYYRQIFDADAIAESEEEYKNAYSNWRKYLTQELEVKL